MKGLIASALIFLIPYRICADVVYDVTGHGECLHLNSGPTDCSSLTYPIAPNAGSNRIVVIGMANGGPCDTTATISNLTYNGSATGITNQTTRTWDGCGNGGAADAQIDQYYLLNENTGANNVAITLSQAVWGLVSTANSFTSVDQTNPVTNSNTNSANAPNSGPATVTVTTAGTDVIVDEVCDGTSVGAVGADQTQNYTESDSHAVCQSQATSTQLGSAGGVMSWSVGAGDTWGITAISLRAASGVYVPAYNNLRTTIR